MIFELTDAPTVEYDGEAFEIETVYFRNGLRNAPLRVWSDGNGRQVHYRPQVGEAVVIDLETGDMTFVEPVENDGQAVSLVDAR